ncbi:ribosomal protein S18 acetylase RimI-like enzyme [Anaerobacterium chartisolvens]|uniref:Ribosomal protein S18 acetylase RimI-like enzyme n=1 Tax=Anaerobacterium chartisolvens TaxID=1297424 RepID=A0A369B8M0_9FIRM|nr:N-acetyltransferase [Anaerobacterium chartisolvens]RCX17879.1 ribosomal protein S18 acetylase RimI-like enzyme [Anaerobacterium chartisolvens]
MIRRAKKTDAPQVAELIYIILDEMDIPMLKAHAKPKVLEFIVRAFKGEASRFSYNNIWVKEIESHAVGMAVVYHGADAGRLDRELSGIIRDTFSLSEDIILDKEAEEEEFYIDSLCVMPEFRGRGIGTELLKSVQAEARDRGLTCLSINVELNNTRAQRLYKGMGYLTEKEIEIAGHSYFHMIKML